MGERLNIPLPQRAAQIIVVLVEPEVQGNVGAVARSMLNFGFAELRVISEQGFLIEDEAWARAKHAREVLEQAVVHSTWDECMEDISLVVGTSGKRETGSKVVFRHFVLPDELSQRLGEVQGKVALLFGREGVGLLTEELQRCDFLVTLPTWEGYPILNLSHAVTLILYELHKQLLADEIGQQEGLPRTVEPQRLLDPELRRVLHEVCDELSEAVSIDDGKREGVAETLKRTIMRGMPLDDEAHRLLGVLTQSRDALMVFGEEE
jgi:TrmH family RNA methyltransferase